MGPLVGSAVGFAVGSTVGSAVVPHDAPSRALDMIERFVASAFEEQC